MQSTVGPPSFASSERKEVTYNEYTHSLLEIHAEDSTEEDDPYLQIQYFLPHHIEY